MESVSHFMAFYCLVQQATFQNTHSDPDVLQLLAFAPVERSPDMQQCEHKQNLLSCCDFQTKQREQKNLPLPESTEVYGTHLYSVERKLGLLGLTPQKSFSIYGKILFVSLIH